MDSSREKGCLGSESRRPLPLSLDPLAVGSGEVSGEVSGALVVEGVCPVGVVIDLTDGSTPFGGRLINARYTSVAAATDGHAMKLLAGYPSTEAFTAPLVIWSVTQSDRISRVHLQFCENAGSTTSEYNPWTRAIRRNGTIGGETLEISLRAGDVRVDET